MSSTEIVSKGLSNDNCSESYRGEDSNDIKLLDNLLIDPLQEWKLAIPIPIKDVGLCGDQRVLLHKALDILYSGLTFDPTSKPKLDSSSKTHNLVSVDGNIGAAKTSLCKGVKTHYEEHDLQIFEECISKEWLDAFNKDPQNMATLFQINQLSVCGEQTSIAKLTSKFYNIPVLCDRSLVGNSVFAITHYLSGNMKESDFQLYKVTFREKCPLPYKSMLYLDNDIFELSKRIYTRTVENPERITERNLTMKYLGELDHVLVATFFYLFVMYGDVMSILFIDNRDFSGSNFVLKNYISIFDDRSKLYQLDSLAKAKLAKDIIEHYSYVELKRYVLNYCINSKIQTQ